MEGASGIFDSNVEARYHGCKDSVATWEANDVELGSETFNYVRRFIKKV